MSSCPCCECECRSPECHGKCQGYLEWATEKRNERIHTNKEKAYLGKMFNYGWRQQRR